MLILLAEDIDDIIQGNRRVAIDREGDEGELAKRRPRRCEMLDFLVIWTTTSDDEGRIVEHSQRSHIMIVNGARFVANRLSVKTKNKFQT